MSASRKCPSKTPIQGQLLRRSKRREVAIFLRDGALWVADFIDDHGQLVDAVTWFRFNCAAPSTAQGRRRMLIEAATPLSEELIRKIEQLQPMVTARKPDPFMCRVATLAKARLRGRLTAVLQARFRHRSVPHGESAAV